MILEKYIGKKIKLYFEDEWQPHHFSSCTYECNLLGVDEQGVLISDDKGKTVNYYPFLLRYKVILDINSDVPQVDLKADSEKAESSNDFEGNDLDTKPKSSFELSSQTLKHILESLSNIKTSIITYQITFSNTNNKAEQDLLKEMLDNIYDIQHCFPDNSLY